MTKFKALAILAWVSLATTLVLYVVLHQSTAVVCLTTTTTSPAAETAAERIIKPTTTTILTTQQGSNPRTLHFPDLASLDPLTGRSPSSSPPTSAVGVVTVHSTLTHCILETAKSMPVVVVLLTDSSPPTTTDKNIHILTLSRQKELFPSFFRPTTLTTIINNKNIGYAYAVLQLNAQWVWDFDEYTCMTPAVTSRIKALTTTQPPSSRLVLIPSPTSSSSSSSVLNPYLLYGARDFIWPRGTPPEVIQRRDWPRMIGITSSHPALSLSVVQFVAEGEHPDTDAIWSLANHKSSCPLTWSHADILESELVAVSPGIASAPYNSHSSLSSSLVMELSYLPSSVSVSTSDIWRSYIVQYYLKWAHSSEQQPTAIGFSGTSPVRSMSQFNHTSSSFLDQLTDEQQLHQQVSSLVAFLTARTPRSARLLHDFIALYDELYTHGFVEESDVFGAVQWATSMVSNSRKMRDTPVTGPTMPPGRISDVTAVIHINVDHRRIIPLWMAILGHRVAEVQFAVAVDYNYPGPDRCSPISGLSVFCHDWDISGLLAYASLLSAMTRQGTVPIKTQGYFWAHDDTIWKHDLDLVHSASYCTAMEPWVPHGWWWKGMVVAATDLWAARKYPNVTWMVSKRGSDEIFIAKKDVAKWLDLALKMFGVRQFLEVANPTMCKAISPDEKPWELVTEWGGERNPTAIAVNFCNKQSAKFAHPIKFDTLAAVLAHFAC